MAYVIHKHRASCLHYDFRLEWEAVYDFCRDPRNRSTIAELLRAGVRPRGPKAPRRQPLRGRRFVFTGTLERFTRPEAQRLVESLGGRAAGSVSSSTNYVVVGDGPGEKLRDARRLGVKTLDEAAFVKLLRERGAEV